MLVATALWWARWHGVAVFVIPIVAYLILVLLGITTSSIGIDVLRQNPADPLGLQIGAPQRLRSDEYWTESPIWLGQMARGGAEDVTPLSVSNDFFAQLPAGPLSSVVFLDGTLLATSPWIPDEMLFAAKWWLPTLMLFLGLPVWFRAVTGHFRWGYLAAFLTLVAPASAWWSGRPINTLGFVAAGCALVLYASRQVGERRWGRAVAGFLVAGILLARLPTYYQPLAIVVGLPLVIATALFVVFSRTPWRQRLIVLGATAASGLFWTAAIFWENRASIAAGLETVYPGARQSTGEPVGAGPLFGATTLGWLEPLSNITPVSQPELVTAFCVLLIPVAFMLTRRVNGSAALRAAILSTVACCGVWLLWSTVDGGSLGAALPLLNRVPSMRAAQGLGYVAIIAFCLLLASWSGTRARRVAIVSGSVALIVTGYAGSLLRLGPLPDMSTSMIWISALGTGLTVFVLLAWPGRWWSLAVAVVAAGALTFAAQPILFGLGDLRASSTARSFMAWGAEARAAGEFWASDARNVDALMFATGTPSLSARQQIGPDVAAWERLDPTREFEGMWNRGGLHISFQWNDSSGLEFSQPAADVVTITGSPCTVSERFPELTHVVSAVPLTSGCLREAQTIEWSGVTYIVYDIATDS